MLQAYQGGWELIWRQQSAATSTGPILECVLQLSAPGFEKKFGQEGDGEREREIEIISYCTVWPAFSEASCHFDAIPK